MNEERSTIVQTEVQSSRLGGERELRVMFSGYGEVHGCCLVVQIGREAVCASGADARWLVNAIGHLHAKGYGCEPHASR